MLGYFTSAVKLTTSTSSTSFATCVRTRFYASIHQDVELFNNKKRNLCSYTIFYHKNINVPDTRIDTPLDCPK